MDFIKCCVEGDLDALKELVNSGYDYASKIDIGFNKTIQFNQEHISMYLLNELKYENYKWGIMSCIENQNNKIFDILIDLDTISEETQSRDSINLEKAVWYHCHEMFDKLIARGIKPNRTTYKYAAMINNCIVINKLLEINPALVNAGEALFPAVKYCRFEMVELLLTMNPSQDYLDFALFDSCAIRFLDDYNDDCRIDESFYAKTKIANKQIIKTLFKHGANSKAEMFLDIRNYKSDDVEFDDDEDNLEAIQEATKDFTEYVQKLQTKLA
jgi:hypothetical protein